MSDSHVIEIRSNSMGIAIQAGIVVRDRRGFRFFAATDTFSPLEGHVFNSPKDAEHAARRRIANVTSPRVSVVNATSQPMPA